MKKPVILMILDGFGIAPVLYFAGYIRHRAFDHLRRQQLLRPQRVYGLGVEGDGQL